MAAVKHTVKRTDNKSKSKKAFAKDRHSGIPIISTEAAMHFMAKILIFLLISGLCTDYFVFLMNNFYKKSINPFFMESDI
jgi:hypothetical protein